jgi:hypothetical protein
MVLNTLNLLCHEPAHRANLLKLLDRQIACFGVWCARQSYHGPGS